MVEINTHGHDQVDKILHEGVATQAVARELGHVTFRGEGMPQPEDSSTTPVVREELPSPEEQKK